MRFQHIIKFTCTHTILLDLYVSLLTTHHCALQSFLEQDVKDNVYGSKPKKRETEFKSDFFNLLISNLKLLSIPM